MDEPKSNLTRFLLKYLDPDEVVAAEKLSELRLVITNTLTLEGCLESEIENLVQVTFDRIIEEISGIEQKLKKGLKPENGEPIKQIENINEFSKETAKIVLQGYHFNFFLQQLDPDPSIASEKYLILQLKLIKILHWKGCPEYDADSLADKILDLISQKINSIEYKLSIGFIKEKGKDIARIENINAYAMEVARLVGMEYFRKYLKNRVDGEDLPEGFVEMIVFPEEPDLRLRCLRKCIAEKVPSELDKQLILQYYDNESDEKNKERREKLRLERELTKSNFKKKVCLLKQRLEKCINECVSKLSVTKPANFDTNNQGGVLR